MKTFALLGHPVSHSLSPQLHNAVFRELRLADHQYLALDTLPEDLESRVQQLRAGDYEGFSVTIPHKQAIIPFLDELSERAQKVGAVNTVMKRAGKIIGDNTDYLGFEKSLEEAGILDSQQKKALVLGSGGAAQAVIAVLLQHGFNVIVASRTSSTDQVGYDQLDSSDPYRLIVNTTPLGMSPDTEASPLTDSTWFRPDRTYVDIIYNPRLTRFLQLAQQAGGRIITGDRMFLWQAVEQSRLFTGQEPPLAVMEAVLQSK